MIAIWYHLYNLKNVKKTTHGGVLLLVKLQGEFATLLKVTLLHECFSSFSNCTNGTKLREASHLNQKLKIFLYRRAHDHVLLIRDYYYYYYHYYYYYYYCYYHHSYYYYQFFI